MPAEQKLREGDLAGALSELEAEVRDDPSSAKKRIFLFQLLTVLGQWDRAGNQLNVVGGLDDETLLMVQAYRAALQAESLREAVYAGKSSPMVFGEPRRWVAMLIEALRLDAAGNHEEAQKLREESFELAPTTAGQINGESFEWIADMDSRLGPILEATVEGKLFWIPFDRIRTVQVDEPKDLRDLVWLPARFTWANGGEAVGMIPVRYPGTQNSEDNQLRMSRKTAWNEVVEGAYHGTGQRMLTTDAGEYALLDLRQLALETAEEPTEATEAPDG